MKASHVETVKMLKEKGWRIIVDDKVGCIVVVESGCLYERIRSYVLASYD